MVWTATTALAAGTVPSDDLAVRAPGFPRVGTGDVLAVLRSATTELRRHHPGVRLPAIEVYYRRGHPQLDWARTASGRLAIGLSSHGTYWAQYSFQFAHEYGHALAHDALLASPPVRYRRHSNLWLEESLCETASLFTLRAMERSWRTAAPHPEWRSYAPAFGAYVQERLARREHQLPAGMSFGSWFARHEGKLRREGDWRDGNTIVARQLLPLFEAEPRGWKAVAFLNRGKHRPEESLAERLTEWHRKSPAELRPFLARLASVFSANAAR